MTQIAIYARVSSSRQEHEETVQSQLEALRAYARTEGCEAPLEFVDEGVSGATLERPQLDRLRDAVRSGEVATILLYAPDRLARKVVYQAILLEEFTHANVRVQFLQGPSDDSDEGRLLLTMQGAIAEYERAKISERTRRGKHHRARQGAVMGGYVPYGYRYMPRDAERRSTLAVDEEQAAVVREMFRLLVEEHQSCRQIARVLTEGSLPTPAGGDHWRASTVGRMLRQEAYVGRFWYARNSYVKSESTYGTGSPHQRRKTIRKVRPAENWIPIKVPAIIEESTFEQAQRQLEENFRFSPRNNKRHEYLLSGGLVRCPRCGAAMSGAVSHGRRLYRCSAADPLNVGDRRACRYPTPAMRAEALEEVVWDALQEALGDPGTLNLEYKRRIEALGTDRPGPTQRQEADRRLARLRSQQTRLMDLYQYGEVDQTELRQRLAELKGHRERLEADLAAQVDQRSEREYLTAVLQSLEAFTALVVGGMTQLDFGGRRDIVRLLVRRVIIADGGAQVQVVLALPSSATEDERHGQGSEHRPVQLRPTGRDPSVEPETACRGPRGCVNVHQDGAWPHPLRGHRQGAVLKPPKRSVGVDALAARPLSQIHDLYHNTYVRSIVGCWR